jgi:hypothetical protein
MTRSQIRSFVEAASVERIRSTRSAAEAQARAAVTAAAQCRSFSTCAITRIFKTLADAAQQ